MSHRRTPTASPPPSQVIAELRELIEALDRRVPHADRSDEIQIGKDAAMLRDQAMARIEALQPAGPNRRTYDQELVDAVMTDDGSPTRAALP